jgi:hypothetical protein
MSRARSVVALLLTLCAAAGSASAQDSLPRLPVVAQRGERPGDLEPHFGLRAGIPLKAALYWGAVRVQRVYGTPGLQHLYGQSVTAAVGLGGAQVGVGRGRVTDAGNGRAQVALLRTWGDPFIADGEQTYLGLEGHGAAGVGFALGVFARLQGRRGGNRAFIAASVQLGI